MFQQITQSNGVKKHLNKSDMTMFQLAKTDDRKATCELNKRHRKPVLVLIGGDKSVINLVNLGLSSDFNIHIVPGGYETLNSIKQLQANIILIDIAASGLKIGHELKNDPSTFHIPFIFLSGDSFCQSKFEGLSTGAIDFISIPFDLTFIRYKLLNIVDYRERIKESLKMDEILEPENIPLSSREEEFLAKSVEGVHVNIDDHQFGVEQLAEYLCLSADQFYRKIKMLTGFTATKFIKVQRLKTAASMIKQRKRDISEIAYMVGFSTPCYFSRSFKEYYGHTPSEFLSIYGID